MFCVLIQNAHVHLMNTCLCTVLLVTLVMSPGSLFHSVKACRKKEYWCDKVFACGMDVHGIDLSYKSIVNHETAHHSPSMMPYSA